MNEPTPVHNQAASRFELRVDGGLADCSYRLGDGVMDIVHTGVPPASEGHGVAALLVRAALAHARAQGLKVRPSCSYVAAYMRRHRDTLDLLVP